MERVARAERTLVLAALVRRFRDVERAEDAFQDACVAALRTWPERGVPSNPAAWLLRAAGHRAVDTVRRDRHYRAIVDDLGRTAHGGAAARGVVARTGSARPRGSVGPTGTDGLAATGPTEPPDDPFELGDDRLRLVFTCCHPAIDAESRVALTLQVVCGLTAREIARAFLSDEGAMAQRLVRVKRKIRDSAIPYEVPPPERLGERLDAVLRVVYLVFNEGHQATEGPALGRADLVEESIRLARLLGELLPGEPEVLGLVSLLLTTAARRPGATGAALDAPPAPPAAQAKPAIPASDSESARASAALPPAAAYVPLEHQDRTRWDRARIDEGIALLDRALTLRRPGRYQILAAISALHAQALAWSTTDWPQITALYTALLRHDPSPVVELNRILARSMIATPDAPDAPDDRTRAASAVAALARLASVPGMTRYQPYHAARASLLRRAGREDEARAAFAEAAALTRNAAERAWLETR